MSNKPFKFKQFTVEQDQCAMKIGTDGVLLGAWANIEHNPFSVLDIGAGTGVISLMLAQRCNAELIDAIEIDDLAYEQCVSNFENSPWGDRLFCYHATFQEFVGEIDDKYDLIISNPPFYTNAHKSNNSQRDLSRFEDALPFEHLVYGASKLLEQNGKFVLIIPFSEEQNFIKSAEEVSLFPSKILRVKGTPESEVKRSLIELTFDNVKTAISELVIETSRHQYTNDYVELTKEFYIKM